MTSPARFRVLRAAASTSLGFLSEAVTDGILGPRLQFLLTAGFCGALSTWSTLSYELLTRVSARRPGTAAGCLLLSADAGVGHTGAPAPGPTSEVVQDPRPPAPPGGSWS
ncbi:CrcB family protein [Streptomyces sp. NPDC002785]|uniref:FluC/FEX family fluoride channel n=1 Tax=Streptomyces sp. NPDC002785 TaxID=3154543 RepID=UPI0033213564